MALHWKELRVWEKAHELVLEIYKTTSCFPASETYNLTGQLRRAASSVPANIVEGQSRNTTREYLKFLYNARGSLEEVRYFLLLARDLLFLDDIHYTKLENNYESASRMLNGLIRSLREPAAGHANP
ncbi:MAG: four helix bundle protein [Deltaproteobacteria bacterium]|nr:four helix bundle protein [Deltaproteobacteria bacterium]